MKNPKGKGVTINDFHTYKDFNLILTDCKIEEPSPITKYVDVPGRKNSLDATESLFGSVTYKNRKIKLSFTGQSKTHQEWISTVSRIANKIHGQLCKVVLDADPSAFWMGRATVAAEKKYWPIDSLTITIDAEPFKYWTEAPDDEWLWDPFSFRDGVIQNLRNQKINGITTVTVRATTRPFVPVVTCTGRMTLRIPAKGDQPETNWILKAGIPKRLDGVLLYDGAYSFIFNGTGTATITFRGESL